MQPVDEGCWSTELKLNHLPASMYTLDFFEPALSHVIGATTTIFRGKIYATKTGTQISGDFDYDKTVATLCHIIGGLFLIIEAYFDWQYLLNNFNSWFLMILSVVMVITLAVGWGVPEMSKGNANEAYDYMKTLLNTKDVKTKK